MSFTKITSRVRLKLLCGSVRRLFVNVLRPGYVRASLAQRRGECRRCGACCQLVCRCCFFRDDDGIPSCAIYDRYRFPNCSSFPVDGHDLADRDLISPDIPCGFWWPHAGKGTEHANK